ncbi:uncharacterized protein LOC105664817 isoform X2 [Ceratitis capitata]|uniref:uncharacterized protein LOC105664817 isoform X2 n=1 Tax=Ceratitis capitata TaxID=7213 RepID=UPI0006188F5F|nr:uncharacterized protein LOC105664817 isoform X2 [Ceratitis capitata]
MKILFAFLLCACGIAITLAAPQYTYVDPYTTSLPQFSQLSSTPYTGYPYNSNGYNGYINYNGYNGYNGYNPYNIFNKYNSYNPYNPYNRNTGTNTYWNGYAWVNSFRSTQAGKK